jgi:hypothetical protein
MFPLQKTVIIGNTYRDISLKSTLVNIFANNLNFLPGIKILLDVLYSNPPYIKSLINPILQCVLTSSRIDINNISDYPLNHTSVSTYKYSRPFLSKVVATFIDMFLSDPDFGDLVVGKYLHQVYPYDELYQLVTKHVDIQDMIVSWLENLSTKGECNVKDLTQLLSEIETTRYQTSEILPTISDKNIESIQISEHIVVKDKSPDPEIITSVQELTSQVNHIVDIINNSGIPYVELNNIIKSVNTLSEYYSLNNYIQPINQCYSGLLVISPYGDRSIPISLKTGNTIKLTTRNYDLSLFSRDELLEILETIDSLVSDDRYDNLRSDITKEISKRI